MTIFYVDHEGGNDNYGGTSFNLLAQGTDGRITTTTFSSATANFPNDGSLINQYVSIWNGTMYATYIITAWLSSTSLTIAAVNSGTALANQTVDRQYYIGGRWKTMLNGATDVRLNWAIGEEIRIKASPDPYSIGQAKWVSRWYDTTLAIQASTNTSPIQIRRDAHGLSTGDYVGIYGHTTNTFANGFHKITKIDDNWISLDGSVGNGVGAVSGTMINESQLVVEIAAPVTKTIADCSLQSGTWVAAANVTTSTQTTLGLTKHKYGAQQIVVAVGHTTGLAAHFPTGTLDLSGYQQISFWIRQSGGTISIAGDLSLALFSNADGTGLLHTIPVPPLYSTNLWEPITFDVGSALSSSVQSVGLVVNVDRAGGTWQIGSIIACKAPSDPNCLTYSHLIGKNTPAEPYWWGIMSIEGTRVLLDAQGSADPLGLEHHRGYGGVSETCTTYARLPTMASDMGTLVPLNLNDSGNWDPSAQILSRIKILGGWNRTDMSTQTGDTWYAHYWANPSCVVIANRQYWELDKVFAFRYGTGINITCGGSYRYNKIGAVGGTCCWSNNINLQINNSEIDELRCIGGHMAISNSSNQVINKVVAMNSLGWLIDTAGVDITINNLILRNSRYGGLGHNGGILRIKSGYAAAGSQTPSQYGAISTFYSPVYVENFTIDSFDEFTSFYAGLNQRIYSHNHDNVPGYHKIFTDYGVIQNDYTIKHGAAQFSWKVSPTSVTFRHASYPLDFKIAKIAVTANKTTTFKIWLMRDNTALTVKFVCKGGQIAGVPNDVVSSMTAAANTWEEVSVQITPTVSGVVEIETQCYGGSIYSHWVSDLNIEEV